MLFRLTHTRTLQTLFVAVYLCATPKSPPCTRSEGGTALRCQWSPLYQCPALTACLATHTPTPPYLISIFSRRTHGASWTRKPHRTLEAISASWALRTFLALGKTSHSDSIQFYTGNTIQLLLTLERDPGVGS